MKYKQALLTIIYTGTLSILSCAVFAESSIDDEVVMDLILEIDNGNNKKCDNRVLEDKVIVHFITDEKIGYNIINQEKWNLNRCGEIIPYIVTFVQEYQINGGAKGVLVKAESAKMLEIVYVRNIAMRNDCDIKGKPKGYINTKTKQRYYELECKNNKALSIECGAVYHNSDKKGCWLR